MAYEIKTYNTEHPPTLPAISKQSMNYDKEVKTSAELEREADLRKLKTNEASKIINFIHRANRTNYNVLESRESDICSFIEREIDRILTQKDKEREEAVAESLPKKGTTLDTVTKWIKKFPRETILTVVSSDTALVITKTPPTIINEDKKNNLCT